MTKEKKMKTKTQKTQVQKALSTISRALKRDPGYLVAWNANIAMAFKDEVERTFTGRRNAGNRRPREMSRELLHRCANNAAVSFIRAVFGLRP